MPWGQYSHFTDELIEASAHAQLFRGRGEGGAEVLLSTTVVPLGKFERRDVTVS